MNRLFGVVALLAAMFLAAVLRVLAPREPAEERERRERDWRKHRKRRILFEVAAILAALGLGGFLVAASGIIPIKASSGHWPITIWFLKFSMHRSFSTHSLGVKVPRLGEPGMVLRGAGHYETACRPCHGSPDLPHPRIAGAMLPVPPYLPDVVHEWKPAELFSVVKHGVKLTGMPAWPAQQRDDEVWAMVAFLLEMPELNAEEYRRLVHGEVPETGMGEPMPDLLGTEPPRAVLATCARCHGLDGRGRARGAFPRLAGQRPAYLYESLQAYARGRRHSGIMEPIAAGLTSTEMRDLALYFARLPAAPPAFRPESAAAVERGRAIAHRGIPGRKVPSCADCHGPGAIRRNPVFPVLAGQDALYLAQQLELFKKKHRGGSPFSRLMHPVAGQMSTEQMRDVALFYESLDPALVAGR